MAFDFNGTTKRITVDSASPDVIVQDMYSAWKVWIQQDDNYKYLPAFRTFGGDTTVEGQTAPAYYFLTNGWRVRVDGFNATFGYNLYTDEGENPVITLNGGTALLNNSDVGIVKSELDKALDYGGYIWVDFDNGTPGTTHPIGTVSQPVDNLFDAITMANAYNFHEIHILEGSHTVTTETLDDFFIVGTSPDAVTLTFTGGATYSRARFRDVSMMGTMSGSKVHVERCNLENLYGFNGIAMQCSLVDNIMVDANGQATMFQCYSGMPGTVSPTLDMNPSNSTKIALRAYSGGLTITNCDIPGDVGTVEYTAGKCTIDASCTEGLLSIRGVAKLTDNSVGTVVDTSALVGNLIDMSQVDLSGTTINVDPTAIADAVWNKDLG